MMTLTELLHKYEANEKVKATIADSGAHLALYEEVERASSLSDLNTTKKDGELIRPELNEWVRFVRKASFPTVDELRSHMTDMLEPGRSE